ncbi:uncharacterized protein LOC116181096 isoform X2 [Photinus pyralis]|uniref:uncharacterized protein LOC116181096 isoform X2 n=1 Tax=Photinus pyralis TaxID=7054 RepID=UPI0012673E14|nr:uncharacterized protein LOC116181096 isoform X2 [Photinus pyralis]
MRAILCFLGCLLLVDARPSWDILGDGHVSSNIRDCHGLQCPAGTVGCSKSSETSADSKTVMATIQCEDIHGKVLNSVTKTYANPHAGTHVSSFSFTGEYSVNGGQMVGHDSGFMHSTNLQPDYRYNKDRDGHGNHWDMVETFDD